MVATPSPEALHLRKGKQLDKVDEALDKYATETLHCQTCDKDFTRELKRGVKPRTCPACKAKGEVAKRRVNRPKDEPCTKRPERRKRSGTGKRPAKSTNLNREAYETKRARGLSLYCAHKDDLGKLCEREGHSETCTCECHPV